MNGCARGSDLIRGNFNRIQREPEIKGGNFEKIFWRFFIGGRGYGRLWSQFILSTAYFTSLRNITPSAESEKPSIGSFEGEVFEVFSQ